MDQQPKRASALAVVSMICGILSFLCIGCLPAIICGHLALARINKDRDRLGGSGFALAGLIMGYVCLVAGILISGLGALLIPALRSAREQAVQVDCMNRLKQISLATHTYCSDNKGALPTDLGALSQTGYLPELSMYRCPAVRGLQISSAADVREFGSYLYFGAGMNLRDVATPGITVLICDRPANHEKHKRKTINIAFFDGHVELTEATSIQEAAQKHNWIIPQ